VPLLAWWFSHTQQTSTGQRFPLLSRVEHGLPLVGMHHPRRELAAFLSKLLVFPDRTHD
jgi:hypothetical protein